MKKVERLFRVFLACVLLLGTAAWHGTSAVKAAETVGIAEAAEKTQLTVSMSVEKGHAGDTVSATVSVSNNPGFAGLATVYTGQTGMVGYSFAEARNYRGNGMLLTV
ncbi:MAG: hypothetical protein J5981_03655 [Lachnospira sp.]|nr:hypothetical protein [Lachnospira sp.]